MPNIPRGLALALFFLSGLSALLYEVVWTRQLTLHFGATAPSLAAVLASYMAGLALGSMGAARFSTRLRNPLLVYGLIEMGVAACAFVFPLILRLSEPLLAATYGEGPTSLFQLWRFVTSFVALLPPTLLMGATLPVLSDALSRDRARVGRDAGLAYAVNTLGAMAGAYLSGFVLIRELGMTGSLRVAIAINLAIGLAAAFLGLRVRRGEPSGGSPGSAGAPSAPGSLSRGGALPVVLVCGVSGLASLSYEVLWTKYFINTLHSATVVFSCILIAYLGGLGGGAFLASRIAARTEVTFRHLAAIQGAIALAVVALLRSLESICDWFFTIENALGSTAATPALLITPVMLVPTLLMGMVLPLGIQLAHPAAAVPGSGSASGDRPAGEREVRVARTVGRIYAASSLGSALGPLVAAFGLLPLVGLSRAILLVASTQAVVALALCWRPTPRSTGKDPLRRFAIAFALTALVLAAFLGLGRSPEQARLKPLYPGIFGPDTRVLDYAETPHGTLLVGEGKDQKRALYLDGFLATSNGASTEYMSMMGHLPMLMQGAPKKALVICLGTGTTLGAMSLYSADRLDCAEINPRVVPAARLFSQENHQVLDDARVRLLLDDGRNWLRRADTRYDVITLEPLAPSFAGTVNLYTREFNQLARERLNPGGVFAQWLPLHLVPERKARMIVRAVRDAFPHVAVWVDTNDFSAIILASDQPLRFRGFEDAPQAAREELARLGHRSVEDLAKRLVLPSGRVDAYVDGAAPVTDDFPSLEYHDPRDGRELFPSLEEMKRSKAQLLAAGREAAGASPAAQAPARP